MKRFCGVLRFLRQKGLRIVSGFQNTIRFCVSKLSQILPLAPASLPLHYILCYHEVGENSIHSPTPPTLLLLNRTGALILFIEKCIK
jgi:hypothetical protein